MSNACYTTRARVRRARFYEGLRGPTPANVYSNILKFLHTHTHPPTHTHMYRSHKKYVSRLRSRVLGLLQNYATRR